MSQAARRARRHRNDIESGITELDTTHEIAERSYPAPLLTPSPSPAASRVESKSTIGRQQDPLPEHRKMKELRGALQDYIFEVIDLQSRLKITKSEVRELHKQH